MMKRIMYISTTTEKLTHHEIEEIGRKSVVNNAKVNVTGVLLSAHEFFFQILEGEPEDVDFVLNRIKGDPRHHDILILKAENEITTRFFSQWSMKTVCLDGTGDLLLEAIRIMLENITESHRIIERYTQPAVLGFLNQGINPLTVPVIQKESVIFFGDIVAFSYFSSLYPVEEVAELVNLFLELSTKAILREGGEVTKYVGDCLVAHFAADATDAALRASVRILEDIRTLRGSAHRCRLQSFLYCGIGISKGLVIQGNIGSSTKLDYTVLGDIVNQASRLESLTRQVGRALAFSDSVRSSSLEPWPFETVGEFHLKGQQEPQPIVTLDLDVVNDFPGTESIIEKAMSICEIADVSDGDSMLKTPKDFDS